MFFFFFFFLKNRELMMLFFFFSSRRRHTRSDRDWSSDVCSSDLGLASWRTAYKRLAIGRMLMGFEEVERGQLRAAIAAVGLAKATVVVPAIERLRAWKPWLEWAG